MARRNATGSVEALLQKRINIQPEELTALFLHFLETRSHKQAFLELAHAVANADGFVSGSEMRYLRSVMAEMGMEENVRQVAPRRTLAEILEEVREPQLRHLFFVEILILAYADGDYSEDEKEIVMDMKRQFNISDEAYETFKSWAIQYDQHKIEGMKLILNPS
ncbi:TerB family tellurite resistance protein [Cohnella boryungensis]|uniref:TerB family tellurite resistance protein n=1 Tax=Cohnella boryungensis TaxID=768479 RepID=A0ABV8SDN4_9BACL